VAALAFLPPVPKSVLVPLPWLQIRSRRDRRAIVVGNLHRQSAANSAVALFALYYNFVRIHKTLRNTPAMAAKVTKRLWEIGDIVDVLEAWENTT
jgi:hypothetical protein